MSKLPYAVEQRDIPNAPGLALPDVASVDNSAVFRAQDQLGKSLEATADVVHKIGEQRDKFNYSVARSKFLQRSADLHNELENSSDYENLPTKYKEGMEKIKQDTLAQLGNNSKAALLNGEMSVFTSRQYEPIAKLAQQKQQEQAITTAYKNADTNLDLIARTNNKALTDTYITTQGELFDAAYADDPIKAMQAKRAFVENVAETKLAQQNPYQRLNTLTQENNKKGSNIAQFLPADKRVALYNSTLAEVNRLEKEKVDTTIVNQALLGNITLDPTLPQNQKAVDTYWSGQQNNLIKKGANSQQILDSSLDIVGRTGIMPSAIKSSLTANITNGTVQQRAVYSKYLVDAADRNPKVLNGLDQKTSSMAFAIANNLRSGLGLQQAVEWAQNDVNEAKKQSNEVLDKTWQQQSKKINASDAVSSMFKDQPGFDLFSKSPNVPSQMIDEYNRLSRGYFVNNKVDLQTANQLAEKTIRSQWGVTDIGGKRYMKYAPETIYGNDGNWIHKQLGEEFSVPIAGKETHPIKDLTLEVDYSTTSTQKPSYFVYRKNPFGSVDLVLDENNLPKKFTPNYQKANAQKIEEHIVKSKEDRKVRDTWVGLGRAFGILPNEEAESQ